MSTTYWAVDLGVPEPAPAHATLGSVNAAALCGRTLQEPREATHALPKCDACVAADAAREDTTSGE